MKKRIGLIAMALTLLLTLTQVAVRAGTNSPGFTYLPVVVNGSAPSSVAIVVDHRHTNVAQIPAQWVTAAKQNVAWIYGHTSHGSQLTSGAQYLSSSVNPPTYRLLGALNLPPAQGSPLGLRVGDDSGWSWNEGSFLTAVRSRLNAAQAGNVIPPGTTGVFLWSWCGELSSLSTAGVQNYLNMMTQLEGEYPAMRFVYMTGHTDGTSGPGSILLRNNQMIRDYVNAHHKLLYDFADIESWLPDGTPYSGTPSDDCPWCDNWCTAHPGFCPSPAISCAHSHSLNCYLKGQALWWLSARIAGWPGN